MRVALHIFKKDMRRLWWGIAIALLLQVAESWFDRSAAVTLTVPPVVLLLLAWAALLAWAVHEDPLVGDRQFWITRPARWRALLGAKLLFAAAVVHLPSFVAGVVVLAVRGFRPWEWLGTLLVQQLLLAAVLTLPVIALAAVLRSFAYLALAIIGIVGLTVFVTQLATISFPGTFDAARDVVAAAAIGTGAAAVVWWQYARRRTWRSRLLGMGAVLAGELVIAFLSPLFAARLRAAVEPAHTALTLRVRTGSSDGTSQTAAALRSQAPPGWIDMSIPVGVEGLPAGLAVYFAAEPVVAFGPGKERIEARVQYFGLDWLVVGLPVAAYRRVMDGSVELKGSVAAIVHRRGDTGSLPIGARQKVAGMGWCSTELIELPAMDIVPGGRRRLVRVACESPQGSLLPAFARLRQSENDAPASPLGWESTPDLSPLKRAATSFLLAPWEKPQASWRVEIVPDTVVGWEVVDFDFPGLRMADYAPTNWRADAR